jgi:hypothetical protein
VAEQYPVKAVQYLRQSPVPGPMYNNYRFGGYLIHMLGSNRKVFIDGRDDIYQYGGVLADYVHISRAAPGTLAILRGYGIRSCLVQPDDPVRTVLAASTDWEQVYADNLSVLLVKQRMQDGQ